MKNDSAGDVGNSFRNKKFACAMLTLKGFKNRPKNSFKKNLILIPNTRGSVEVEALHIFLSQQLNCNHRTFIRNRCAREEQPMSFDLFKAFD